MQYIGACIHAFSAMYSMLEWGTTINASALCQDRVLLTVAFEQMHLHAAGLITLQYVSFYYVN